MSEETLYKNTYIWTPGMKQVWVWDHRSNERYLDSTKRKVYKIQPGLKGIRLKQEFFWLSVCYYCQSDVQASADDLKTYFE